MIRLLVVVLLVSVMVPAAGAGAAASDLPPGTVTLQGRLAGGGWVEGFPDRPEISDYTVLWNDFEIRLFPPVEGEGRVTGNGKVRRSMIYTYVLEDRTDVFRYRDQLQFFFDGTWEVDGPGRVTATVTVRRSAAETFVEVLQGRPPQLEDEDWSAHGHFDGTWSAGTGRLTGEIRMASGGSHSLEADAVATEPGAPEATTTSQPTPDEELARIRIEQTEMECGNAEDPIYLIVHRTPTRDHAWFQSPLNISYAERIVAVVEAGAVVAVPDGFEVEFRAPSAWGYLKGPAVARARCQAPTDYPILVLSLMAGLFTSLEPYVPGYVPQVETPHIVTGVMGTGFIIEVTETETRVVVLEGTVMVTGVTAGQQTVTAGYETVSDGSTVAEPLATDPDGLAARYPWLDYALDARTEVHDLPGSIRPAAADAQGDEAAPPFPLWPLVIGAGAALALIGVAGGVWTSRRRVREGTAWEVPPPPPPAPERAGPPPPRGTG